MIHRRTKSRLIISCSLLFKLLQKNLEKDDSVIAETEKDSVDFSRIRCPKCKWQPSARSLWYCGDCLEPEFYLSGCGCGWNTFNTRGKCPGCSHVWRFTSCHSCSSWSLHEDWYDNDK